MSKLEETLSQHPELSPEEATRIEVRKVSEPIMRDALLALVDLVEIHTRPMVRYVGEWVEPAPLPPEPGPVTKLEQPGWPTGIDERPLKPIPRNADGTRDLTNVMGKPSEDPSTHFEQCPPMLESEPAAPDASSAKVVITDVDPKAGEVTFLSPAPEPAPASTKTKSVRPAR